MSERIGLVGCVKQKLPEAAPAMDLYTSPLFRGRRAYVERSCSRWFILSAKHGLVDPAEILEPYDETLNDSTPSQRQAWSARVLMELRRRLGELGAYEFEVHAGANYVEFGLEEGLRAAGASVLRPAQGLGLGEQLAFYGSGETRAPGPPAQHRQESAVAPRSGGGASRYRPLAEFLSSQRGNEVELRFSDVEALVGELPASARNHRPWWANDRSHSQARSWLDAGWSVSGVNITAERVTFGRGR